MAGNKPSDSGTLGIILIGDEILSGSVVDKNSDYIINAFTQVGYEVEEIRVIPDRKERIAECFREFSPRFDFVISSGGVGPTHDDVTLEAAAEAFDVPLVLDGQLSAFLENHYGDRMNESLRRMAMVPQGAETGLEHPDGKWPLIRFSNAFILPGLPLALQDKVDRIIERIQPKGAFAYGEVFLTARESDYVDWLNVFQEEHWDVYIGSYPYWDQPEYNTRLTVRSRNAAAVREATHQIVEVATRNGWLVRWNLEEPEQIRGPKE